MAVKAPAAVAKFVGRVWTWPSKWNCASSFSTLIIGEEKTEKGEGGGESEKIRKTENQQIKKTRKS